jgi:hypothetical protein
MTNANPARGQKSARRKTARETHAEHPKFQVGQRVACRRGCEDVYGEVGGVLPPAPGGSQFIYSVRLGGESIKTAEGNLRLARPTPQVALEHARRQFDEAITSEDRYTGRFAKARAEIADAVKRLTEASVYRVGDEMADLIEGVAEASAFLKLVDWMRPMDAPGEFSTRGQYRTVLAGWLDQYTSDVLNQDGYRHNGTRESASITNRAEFKALQEARKFLAWQLHRLDTALACERWVTEGRQEIPKPGQDGRPVPPDRA